MEAQRNFIDNPFQSFEVLLKSERAGHKYIKRTGVPGSYRYYYQQPSTGKGTVKINGEEYGIESQVPLEQSPKFAAVADSIFKVTDSKGHASYLMHLKTGKWSHYKNLKQQDASVDGVDAGGESEAVKETATEKKEKKAIKRKKQDEVLAQANVREAVESEQSSEEIKQQYVNSRPSAIPQIGEDVPDSARHKALKWKGLRESEMDGSADKMITRKMLSQFEGHDILDNIREDNLGISLVAATLMNKFPPEPKYNSGYSEHNDDDAALVIATVSRYNGTPREIKYAAPKKDGVEAVKKAMEKANFTVHGMKVLTMKDLKKQSREVYYNTYKGLTELANQAVKEGSSIGDFITDVNVAIKGFSDKAAEVNSTLYKQLERYRNSSTAVSYDREHGWASNLELESMKVNQYAKENNLSTEDRIALVSKVAEGSSIDSAMGKVKRQVKSGIPRMEDYYKGEAERVGAEIPQKTFEEHENLLRGGMGMRAIQWGNSVPDKERAYHLQMVSESFTDLSKLLDLPEKMMSFNGRLAVGVAARGTGKALATYKADIQFINMTRDGGIGSLAHEWGHFFDNILSLIHSDTKERKREYLSNDRATWSKPIFSDGKVEWKHATPVAGAMHSLMKSEPILKFRGRLDDYFKKLASTGEKKAGRGRSYWNSEIEVFARCFERYVQNKLESKGLKNTYLADSPREGMWMTDEEVAQVSPYFDKLFEEFKKSDMLKKSMEVFKNDDLKKSIHELIEEIKGRL